MARSARLSPWSTSAPSWARIAATLGTGESWAFVPEIARRYESGVSWLASVDCASLTSGFGQGGAGDSPAASGQANRLPHPTSSMLGLLNMRYLFFEQRLGRGRDENEATLSFQGSRTGIASWLAPPGSAGSMEYVSSEAVMAFSASTRDPRQALDEMLSAMGPSNGMAADIRKFESEIGVSLGNDIASSLGTDFSFAIERPSLPIPGWVAAIEVVRPTVLDEAVRRLIDAYNRNITPEHSDPKMTLAHETVNRR